MLFFNFNKIKKLPISLEKYAIITIKRIEVPRDLLWMKGDENSMKYTLMNKENPVLSFETYTTATGATKVKNELTLNQEMLPVDYDGNIKNYINRRKAPKHREHIEKLLIQLGAQNIEGYIDVCNAASLTDTFWVRNEDKPLTWAEVSLYQNEFDENIARIAIDGGNASFSNTSPELSVDGQYAKCWIREGDDLYLLKRGSQRYSHREVHAEYYASQIISTICTDSVEYEIVYHNEKVASKCHIFTSEEFGYSPISSFYNHRFGTDPTDFLKEFEKYDDGMNYRRMVVADALILNIDRHLGNFGYLVNNDTQIPAKMAPAFDFNRSMLFNLTDQQFGKENLNEIVATPFTDGAFITNAKEVLTEEIISDLKNMRGFKFKNSSIENWPNNRLSKYEQFIDSQIDNILGQTRKIIHNIPQIKRSKIVFPNCAAKESEIEK